MTNEKSRRTRLAALAVIGVVFCGLTTIYCHMNYAETIVEAFVPACAVVVTIAGLVFASTQMRQTT